MLQTLETRHVAQQVDQAILPPHVKRHGSQKPSRTAKTTTAADNKTAPRFEIVSRLDALQAYRQAWVGLEQSCANTVLFQSFAWCANYLTHGGEEARKRAQIIVIFDQDSVVAVAPFSIRRYAGLKVLTGLTEPYQQFTDILLAPATDPHRLRPVLMAAMRATGADYVHLGQVRADSNVLRVLGEETGHIGEVEGAPYIEIGQYADFDTYLKTVKSKTRKNLRNARNRLEKHGDIAHSITRARVEVATAVERVFEGREVWLESMGMTSRAFNDTDFQSFLAFLAKEENDLDLVALTLRQGDIILSEQWGIAYRGRYYAYMANWNMAYESFSPGRLHLGMVIEACFAEGFEQADFLIPASDYKRSWTDEIMPVQDRMIPLSVAGDILVRGWFQSARPLAKKAFFALPKGLRNLIIARMG